MLPKVQPIEIGLTSSYMIYGAKLGGGGYGDCPYRLIRNYRNSSNNWDYTATNSGWNADNQFVYLAFNNSSPIKIGDYYLITYKYS